MSDSQSRPSVPRGRGLSRVSRGGGVNYGSRGGAARGGGRSKANGDQSDQSPELKYEDEGEIGELKRKYSGQLTTLKELFPDWTDEDIVFALQETDGDLDSTIERISEGMIIHFTWAAVCSDISYLVLVNCLLAQITPLLLNR